MITIAVQLFSKGKLTIGQALKSSSLSRFEFEKELAKNNIALSKIDPDKVWKDVDKLSNL